MRQFGRLRLSLAFFACVLGSALAAGPAAAQGPQDPQTTNIPYLAWRGEQVRLVKCDPSLGGEDPISVDWIVEQWTGPGIQPQVETSTITGFDDCVAADVVTLDPGLARIKLVVSDGDGKPILKHQFLSVWMSLNDPSIHEVSVTDPTGDPTLGDPPGDGIFDAGDTNGRIQVKVKGSFPHPDGPGGSFTLPDAWPQLANALADDSDSNPDNNAARWDIHDDLTKFEPHVGGYCTTGVVPTTQDAVDNCNLPSTDRGPFSRVFGDFAAAPVIGPFDPLVGNTLLSDGRLNADDAPMPATRVDVAIAANKGGSDLGGVGSLEPADKTAVYSRNTLGTPSAHNYYAPFYDTYIPSTSRGPLSSGIDGPAQGNNFRGFLVDGLYNYWSFAEVLRTAVPVSTTCLRSKDGQPVNRQTPAGPQNVAVYTDEHGEAQVEYHPGTGAYYNSLGIRSANGGCDLEGVKILGTSSITATARYPYQSVGDPAKVSQELPKEVHSLFTKYLGIFPKGPGDANSNARIVVAHAQDVDGTPFVNERVCFNVAHEADGAFGYSGQLTPTLFIGGSDAPLKGTADVCRFTDQNGNAAVEVLNSHPEVVNVIADFDPEGLFRDADVDFRTATTPPPPGPFVPHRPATGPVSIPTDREVAEAGITPKKATTASKKVQLRYARLVKRHGKVYLVVKTRANGHKYVTLRVRSLAKHGRKLGTWTRRIRAGRTVTIRVSAKAVTARVRLSP
jgi:hypothetical protein